ncbi:MAG: nicotinate (nicotinamide) nucleotide adenylyltransferase [Treponema sp.]|nr:nicotinate (nicotinamide) nucleotide adenylyltransferase [Treponema sp.]
MKIAVYGGSFNPIHCGHLTVADETLSLGYDKVLFVPTFIAPHKQLSASVSPSSRVAMLEAASSDNPNFEVEPCEIQRGGVSYTIDTIRFLMDKYKGKIDGKLGLVMGQEIAAEFYKWKGPDEIASLCDIIIASRQNLGDKRSVAAANKPRGDYIGGVDANGQFMDVDKKRFVWPYTELKNVIVPISSTDIRNRILQKKSWRYLLPQAVYEYIVTNRLYGYKQ